MGLASALGQEPARGCAPGAATDSPDTPGWSQARMNLIEGLG